jgi:hypothetical protein
VSVSVDLTAVVIALNSGVITIIGGILTYIIDTRMKNTQNAKVLADAIHNSIGFVAAASETVITAAHPQVTVKGISPETQAQLQYVLDHAGSEAASFGITQEAILDKITAAIGNRRLDAMKTAPTVSTGPVETITVAPVVIEPQKTAQAS